MVFDIFPRTSLHRLCGIPIRQDLSAVLTHISPRAQAIFSVCLTWLVVVRIFRWKRYNSIHGQFQAKYHEKTITPEEAQKIIQVSMMYDMPFFMYYASAYAIFEPCAIVSILPNV